MIFIFNKNRICCSHELCLPEVVAFDMLLTLLTKPRLMPIFEEDKRALHDYLNAYLHCYKFMIVKVCVIPILLLGVFFLKHSQIRLIRTLDYSENRFIQPKSLETE